MEILSLSDRNRQRVERIRATYQRERCNTDFNRTEVSGQGRQEIERTRKTGKYDGDGVNITLNRSDLIDQKRHNTDGLGIAEQDEEDNITLNRTVVTDQNIHQPEMTDATGQGGTSNIKPNNSNVTSQSHQPMEETETTGQSDTGNVRVRVNQTQDDIDHPELDTANHRTKRATEQHIVELVFVADYADYVR